MEAFVLFIITVLAWFGLEFYYVLRGQPTISERIRDLNKIWRSLGFLATLIVALLIGHFFLGVGTPTESIVSIVAAIAFGLFAGAVWFR